MIDLCTCMAGLGSSRAAKANAKPKAAPEHPQTPRTRLRGKMTVAPLQQVKVEAQLVAAPSSSLVVRPPEEPEEETRVLFFWPYGFIWFAKQAKGQVYVSVYVYRPLPNPILPWSQACAWLFFFSYSFSDSDMMTSMV